MKKIKIIGIITILIILCENVFTFSEGISSFKEGWDSDGKNKKASTASFYLVDVQLTAEMQDSLYNTKMGCNVPYAITRVKTFADFPGWVMLIVPFALVAGLCYLYGFYSLIRLLIAVLRREVFIEKNVFRLRVFAYSQAAAIGLFWLFSWVSNHYIIQQLQLPGYEVKGDAGFSVEWMLLMLIILFAEIFAVGVKIKEEQDLTI